MDHHQMPPDILRSALSQLEFTFDKTLDEMLNGLPPEMRYGALIRMFKVMGKKIPSAKEAYVNAGCKNEQEANDIIAELFFKTYER